MFAIFVRIHPSRSVRVLGPTRAVHPARLALKDRSGCLALTFQNGLHVTGRDSSICETHTLATPQIHAHGLAYRKKQRNHHANVAVHRKHGPRRLRRVRIIAKRTYVTGGCESQSAHILHYQILIYQSLSKSDSSVSFCSFCSRSSSSCCFSTNASCNDKWRR